MPRRLPRRLPSGVRRALLGAAGTALVLGGCAVGTRGTLTPETPTGDAAVDAFVASLPRADQAVFTATYTVSVPMTGLETTAAVAQQGPDRRGVTVGDVRFVFGARGRTETCTVSTGECRQGLDPSRTSDTGLGPTWPSRSLRARVRTDLDAAVAVPVASTSSIAGEDVTCIDIALAAGPDGASSQYCALANGVIARIVRADVVVELTSYADTADRALLNADIDVTTTGPTDTADAADTLGAVELEVTVDTSEPAASGAAATSTS